MDDPTRQALSRLLVAVASESDLPPDQAKERLADAITLIDYAAGRLDRLFDDVHAIAEVLQERAADAPRFQR
jgi:hypothetical protein